MDSPCDGTALKSVRCLFPDNASSTRLPTFASENDAPVSRKSTPFSVVDIIKQEPLCEDDVGDDSLTSDDSGTGALHIDFGDISREDGHTDSGVVDDCFPSPSHASPEPHDELKVEGCSRQPMLPYSIAPIGPPMNYMYPFHPMNSVYPFHPMMTPEMFPLMYSGCHPFAPPGFPTMLPPTTQQFDTWVTPNGAATRINSEGRTSPADSLSSGAYSNPSPSPSTGSGPEPSPEPCPVSTASIRPSGGRSNYTQGQVQVMQQVLSRTRYPDHEELDEMSAQTGIPTKKIKVWFQNRRARSKCERIRAIPVTPSAYGYLPNPMMSLPFPIPSAPIMPFHAGYQYPQCVPSHAYRC